MANPLRSITPPPKSGLLDAVWQYFRVVYEAVSSIRSGKLDCTNTLTLTAGTTSTTLVDIRISAQSCILLMPTTANAAAALATTYISPTKESATVTHANNAQVDRTFVVSILG